MLTSARPVFGFVPASTNPRAVIDLVSAPTDRVRLVVTPNLDHVARLRRSAPFRDAYRGADLVLCDGFPVRAYARLHAHRAHRVTGCDVVSALMDGKRAIAPGARLFFAADSVATADAIIAWAERHDLADRVATAIPQRGFASDPDASAALVRAVAAHGTTLLVMAVGAPQSEIFVHRQRATLPACWAICVGQAVKAELGLTRRAPRVARRIGLEWVWRVVQEPRRLGRRYLLGGLEFGLAVAEDLLDHGQMLLGPEG